MGSQLPLARARSLLRTAARATRHHRNSSTSFSTTSACRKHDRAGERQADPQGTGTAAARGKRRGDDERSAMTMHDAPADTVLHARRSSMSASRRRSRCNRTWRASDANTSWSMCAHGAASRTSRSSTTISGDRRVAPSTDRASIAWSRALCAEQVGAVLCLDASRLARNGRDWHHLLELCGLVEARVIDLDGVYDPCRPNDRLLLGHEGQHQRVRAWASSGPGCTMRHDRKRGVAS